MFSYKKEGKINNKLLILTFLLLLFASINFILAITYNNSKFNIL